MKFEKFKRDSCPGLLKKNKIKRILTNSETEKMGNKYTKNAKLPMD